MFVKVKFLNFFLLLLPVLLFNGTVAAEEDEIYLKAIIELPFLKILAMTLGFIV